MARKIAATVYLKSTPRLQDRIADVVHDTHRRDRDAWNKLIGLQHRHEEHLASYDNHECEATRLLERKMKKQYKKSLRLDLTLDILKQLVGVGDFQKDEV